MLQRLHSIEQKANTNSGPMLNRLSELMLKADADPEIRAIVITGSGKFCAGLISVAAISRTT